MKKGTCVITDMDVIIGERIRYFRLLEGHSQVMLADALGISFQQLQKMERAKNRVSAARLYQIARLYGRPIDHFFKPLREYHRPIIMRNFPDLRRKEAT